MGTMSEERSARQRREGKDIGGSGETACAKVQEACNSMPPEERGVVLRPLVEDN